MQHFAIAFCQCNSGPESTWPMHFTVAVAHCNNGPQSRKQMQVKVTVVGGSTAFVLWAAYYSEVANAMGTIPGSIKCDW